MNSPLLPLVAMTPGKARELPTGRLRLTLPVFRLSDSSLKTACRVGDEDREAIDERLVVVVGSERHPPA